MSPRPSPTTASRNVWFIFTPTKNAGPATLSVRTFDATKRQWTELSTAQVPAPKGPEVLAVLKDRILYASGIGQDGAPPTQGFTLLDTTDLKNVSVRGTPQSPPLDAAKYALLGLNAWPAKAGAGGNVTMIVEDASNCGPTTSDGGASVNACPIDLVPASVGATDNAPSIGGFKQVAMMPALSASTVWTADRRSGDEADILVLPPLFPGSNGHVRSFNRFDQSQVGTPIPFAINAGQLSGAAFDPCRNLVIATELKTARGIYVIPRDPGGVPISQSLSTTAQGVFYEPYTRTVIRQFTDQSNFELSAYLIKGTNTAPTLSQRLSSSSLPWNPPVLDPRMVAVKIPPQAVNCN